MLVRALLSRAHALRFHDITAMIAERQSVVRHTTAHRFLLAGFLCLAIAAAAYATLHLTRGPSPVFIRVRWAPGVEGIARQVAERRYGLSEAEPLEGRTWGYTLSDLSTANVRALVGDPAVEDTQDIDRTAFRASATAERRPYPVSGSLMPVSLWVVTVLCLFVGLMGVSLGLIGRAAPGSAAVGFAPQPMPEQRLTTAEGRSLLFIAALMGVCFLLARTIEPRVDEANHLGQIQRYLAGNYATTSTASGGFHATAAVFAWLSGRSDKESIRLFVLLISGATILTFRSLVKSFAPQASSVRTLQFALFPLLFPFWFLIYTDVLGLLLLLLAVLALTRERFHVTGILAALSVAVRQTYVVWLALLGVWTAVVNSAGPLRQLARRGISFGIAAALFLLFVAANDGVAIGDRDSHPEMELHTENLLFMLVCFFLMFLPLIVSRLPRIVRLHPAVLLGIALSSVVLFFGTFRVDHPYNHNDITEDVFLRNTVLQAMTSSTFARVASSVAIALAALSLFVIRLRQPVHYLIYPFAALSVMPVWLIEQRYYLPAFALFMLFRESASPGVEIAMIIVNGLVAIYLFEGVVRGLFFL
jgi:alpha-1,2-glucosyltransferase